MARRFGFLLIVLLAAAAAQAQLAWVGDTRLFQGPNRIPARSGYVESWQAVTVTTQTYPIAPGQIVYLIYTTDNFQTVTERQMTFDFNQGQNSQWFTIIGPFPRGSEVKFYIRAHGNDGTTLYDNNGSRNFGYYSRWAPPFRRGAILQWFATDYRTILRRLPEVVLAGYDAIYLPPPQKSGGGGFSVGYNPFDRFDLGDRLSLGTVATRYGTTQELIELIRAAHRLGIKVYADLVFNHNDNRASTPIDRYPDMIPEDFHIRSSADTGNNEIDFNSEGPFTFGTLNYDLIGLADIAQEDGNNTQTGPFDLPAFAAWNAFGKPTFVRQPRNPAYYPGGTPIAEDVREYLKRWTWFLSDVIGLDGYRLDAVKHVPPSFFDNIPDSDQPGSWASRGDLLPEDYARKPETYVFSENYTTNPWELREYVKTGMNMLDFPLKFAMDALFNSNGYGSLGATLSNGYGLDPSTGLPYELGGLSRDIGVSFVQSHDQGPPWSNNLAYAWAFSRPGRPLVYYDGNNLNPGDYGAFPKPGRADALGSFDDTLVRLLDARNRFGRGDLVNRYVSDHLYIAERVLDGVGLLLVGLNNRGDAAPLSATVATAFAPGSRLRDLSGQQPDLVVSADRTVSLTVPPNSDGSSENNARGYVLYAPVAPEPVDPSAPVRLLLPTADAQGGGIPIAFEDVSLPRGPYGEQRVFQAANLTGDVVNVEVATDPSGASAVMMIDDGYSFTKDPPLQGTPEGLSDGYVPMLRSGAGRFEARSVNLTGLGEGLHVIRVRVFRAGSGPGVFSELRAFFYLKRPRQIQLDGDLSDLGAPIATQTRTPTSQGNRIDILYARNDDANLYIGVAGTVENAEPSINGVAVLLDTGPGGVYDMGVLEDDSGPATRLLSNASITAPFGADFAFAALRRSQAGSSPEAAGPGEPITTQTVGASAGGYVLDESRKRALQGIPLALAWRPRAGPFDPPTGLEAAVPLRSLFGQVVPGSSVKIVAYLLTTGERGTTLSARDPLRATAGGYGPASSWLSNQILPPQPGINGDPGFSPTTLQSYATYSLALAQVVKGMTITFGRPSLNPYQGTYSVVATSSPAARAVAGPIIFRIAPSPGAQLANRTGGSVRFPGWSYIIAAPGGLAAGERAQVILRFRAPSASFKITGDVWAGRGAI